ncbi:hypothetical protein LPN04_30985 [Rugamonas sp. A1-17]|nr:hypothetical protein [Rugamonas sp. A1-17]
MYIVDPATLSKWDQDRLMEGYLQNRLGILEHAMEHADQAVSAETIRDAVAYIVEAAGVPVTEMEFAKMLKLYPYAVAKFADYGWGDTEIREMALDVLTNTLLGTRWPTGRDSECDLDAFLIHLRFAHVKAKPLFAA